MNVLDDHMKHLVCELPEGWRDSPRTQPPVEQIMFLIPNPHENRPTLEERLE